MCCVHANHKAACYLASRLVHLTKVVLHVSQHYYVNIVNTSKSPNLLYAICPKYIEKSRNNLKLTWHTMKMFLPCLALLCLVGGVVDSFLVPNPSSSSLRDRWWALHGDLHQTQTWYYTTSTQSPTQISIIFLYFLFPFNSTDWVELNISMSASALKPCHFQNAQRS